MKWKRLLISMMIGILGTSAPVSAEEIQGHPAVLSEEDSEKTDFRCWNENAPSLAALKEYVEDVTDDNSPNYIPEEDRIAVFDMDGTLYGELAPTYIEWCMYAYRVNEDSSFLPDQDEKDVAEQIVEVMKTGVIPEDLERDHSIQNARVYAGMTVDGYRQYVREFCKRPVVGFDKMTFKDAFYKPMIEVVNYLDENGFTVYICSGTDRILCRELTDGVLPITENHIIGMDVMLKARGQGSTRREADPRARSQAPRRRTTTRRRGGMPLGVKLGAAILALALLIFGGVKLAGRVKDSGVERYVDNVFVNGVQLIGMTKD